MAERYVSFRIGKETSLGSEVVPTENKNPFTDGTLIFAYNNKYNHNDISEQIVDGRLYVDAAIDGNNYRFPVNSECSYFLINKEDGKDFEMGNVGRPVYFSGGIPQPVDYISTTYGGTGLTSFTANRMVWTSSVSELSTSGHYVDVNHLAVNSIDEPTHNFYVDGTSGFTDSLHIFNEGNIIYKINRKKAGGSGWAYAPFRVTGNDDGLFASIGVYGNADEFKYMYLGTGSYDDASTNVRITTAGSISIPGGQTITPRTDATGSVGTSEHEWNEGYFRSIKSGDKLYITPSSTLYLDSGSSSSIIFRPQGTAQGGFNTSGQFYLKSGASYTATLSGPDSANGVFYFPNTGGTFVTHATRGTAVGGTAKPVYIAATGRATALSATKGSSVIPTYLNSGTITECNMAASGDWWGALPAIGNDGVIEIGRYIDFHTTDAGTSDYDIRIDAGANAKANTLYLPDVTGQVVVHTNNTAIGGSTRPVYIASSGAATAITATAIAYGGTGATTAAQARTNLHYSAATITSTTNDTIANWSAKGPLALDWYSTAGQITDQPNQFGLVLNISKGTTAELHQLWFGQPNNDIYHRGGNANGWSGSWKKLLDTSNYTDTLDGVYVNVSGDAMTGTLRLGAPYQATASSRYSYGALEIREAGRVGNAQSTIGYAPRIGFHWSGRVAASLVLNSSAQFQFRNQADDGYAPVRAGVVTATRLIATSSTDAAAASANAVGLIVGSADGTHLEIDNNEIIAKSDGTTGAVLSLNSGGTYTKLYKICVSTDTYGSTLPSSGTTGQIFFKLI